MTDAELIARLLDWREHDEGKINDAREAAADRIEALTKERDDFADQISELLPSVNREAVEQRQRADAAEAKLAKAVELALEECPFREGTPSYNKWWHDRRNTLAEIKGDTP